MLISDPTNREPGARSCRSNWTPCSADRGTRATPCESDTAHPSRASRTANLRPRWSTRRPLPARRTPQACPHRAVPCSTRICRPRLRGSIWASPTLLSDRVVAGLEYCAPPVCRTWSCQDEGQRPIPRAQRPPAELRLCLRGNPRHGPWRWQRRAQTEDRDRKQLLLCSGWWSHGLVARWRTRPRLNSAEARK